MTQIAFTGTQKGMTPLQIIKFKELLDNFSEEDTIEVFRHGDCIGADEQAHLIITEYELANLIIIHPPKEPSKRAYCEHNHRVPVSVVTEQDYLIRNREMVNNSDLLIATPYQNDEVKRSNTWATIRYAKKIGLEVHVIYPNGIAIANWSGKHRLLTEQKGEQCLRPKNRLMR